MLRYALYSYIPKRYARRISFEESDVNRLILDFKSGRKYASERVARDVATCLSAVNLKDAALVCIPASCERTTRRRYLRFHNRMEERCGIENTIEHIHVIGKREKRHRHGTSQLNIRFDNGYFKGKDVILFDDICTTGYSSQLFMDMLEKTGANVRMVIFLAKTKRIRQN